MEVHVRDWTAGQWNPLVRRVRVMGTGLKAALSLCLPQPGFFPSHGCAAVRLPNERPSGAQGRRPGLDLTGSLFRPTPRTSLSFHADTLERREENQLVSENSDNPRRLCPATFPPYPSLCFEILQKEVPIHPSHSDVARLRGNWLAAEKEC